MQETDMKEKLQKIIEAYDELQAKMGDPAVLADQKEYNRLAKEYASQGPLAKKAAEYVAAMDDLEAAKEMLSDADMKEFAQEEIASIEAKLPQLEEDIKFMLIPADPADEKDIIVEIRAAAGGDEAAIFAGDLYKMYERFAAAQGWKTETMDASPSEAGGFKEIQFKVKGDHVYSVMKFESGVHRVQRVPKTESQGRIHTSTATVAVLPEADEVEEHDRLRRAHHAPAHGSRGAVPGPKVAAAEQDRGHGRAARPPLREDARRAAGSRGRRAPGPDRLRRPLREDPHLQRPAGPRDRPPHRLQLHLQRGASGRQPGGCDHGSAGGRPRAKAGSCCLAST